MTASSLLVLATEGGIPTSNPWSQLAVPLGILIFVGSVYMLLRSNLGTRRGYLVMSTSLWGFTFLLSLFWWFGAPGTPAFTGPQNLPGTESDAYTPVWVPFAGDAAVVTEDGSPYAAAATYPEGWGAVPDGSDLDTAPGVQGISSLFSGLATAEDVEANTYRNLLTGLEVLDEDPLYAVADNGRPMIAATFVPSCQLTPDGETPSFCEGVDIGAPVPAGSVDDNGNAADAPVTLFAFFDAGAPAFPSILMSGILLVLFVLHMLLLARDETRERKEAEAAVAETVVVEEKATVSV